MRNVLDHMLLLAEEKPSFFCLTEPESAYLVSRMRPGVGWGEKKN